MLAKEFPKDKEYELSLLLKADPEFRELSEYLDVYIKLVLGKFEMPQEIFERLYLELHGDIPVAAEKYLQSDARKKDYKFSTYFSWYISERLNKQKELRRKAE
jgi:hypothetical protein